MAEINKIQIESIDPAKFDTKRVLDWRKLTSDKSKFTYHAGIFYDMHKLKKLPDYTITNYEVNESLFPDPTVAVDSFYFHPATETIQDKKHTTNLDPVRQINLGSEYSSESPQVKHIKKLFNITYLVLQCQLQKPDTVFPIHVDNNSKLMSILPSHINFTTDDIKGGALFLTDWTCGQIFMVGASYHTNWKKGDVIAWPWYMPHATVNASMENRKLLFIRGI